MLPPVLVYAAALTAGVLSAIALQIYLARAGYGVAPLWERLSSTRTLNLRTTGPWWAIAGISFLVSGVTAAALSRASFPLRRLRLARWIRAQPSCFCLPISGTDQRHCLPLMPPSTPQLALQSC